MASSYTNPRIDGLPTSGDAGSGRVVVDLVKLLWVVLMAGGSIAALFVATPGAIALFLFATAVTLCFGHSLGMHRRFIHRSYDCPKWLEYVMVHLGTLVGLAGPFGMLRTHDTRDWAQRQRHCHPYFSHESAWTRDVFWQLCCSIELSQPPQIKIEPEIEQDPVYRWMERTWMAQQLPWGAAFYLIGGWSWVLWGICVRVLVSIIGHWLIGFFAHGTPGDRWLVQGAAIQGRNVPWVSLLTMGECWHNNHHAFPGSARLGLYDGQWDPGWWVLKRLERVGLAGRLVLPSELPKRSELTPLQDPELVSAGPISFRL